MQVRRHLPTGINEWKRVTEDYNSDRDHVNGPDDAEMERVRNKFTSLYQMKKPTGNHVKSPFISEAQEIMSLIEKKVHGALESPPFPRSSQSIIDDDDNDVDDPSPSQFIDPEEKSDGVVPAAVTGQVALDDSVSSASLPSSLSSSSLSSASSSRHDKKRKHPYNSNFDLKAATDSINNNLSSIVQQQMSAMREERLIRQEEMKEERAFRKEEMKEERALRQHEFRAITEALQQSFVVAIQAVMSNK